MSESKKPKVVAVRWVDSDGKPVEFKGLDPDGSWPKGVPLYRIELVYNDGQVWREPE